MKGFPEPDRIISEISDEALMKSSLHQSLRQMHTDLQRNMPLRGANPAQARALGLTAEDIYNEIAAASRAYLPHALGQ